MALFKGLFKTFFAIDRHERLKVFFLSVMYCLIVAFYTISKEFKDSIFMNIVGRSYVPKAKFLVFFVLIPVIIFYSKLVDKLRRYQLLIFFTTLFGVLGLIFTMYLGHPTIGLPNTNQSPYRLFGWLLYFFIEGFSPFVLSVFWAFVNSINSPDSAKKNYGPLVSGSKIGGMLSAGTAWFFLSSSRFSSGGLASDVFNHQVILGVASVLLLLVPIVTIVFMKRVSGRYLHGYEAAYQHEKQKSKEGKVKTGIFAGLMMLLNYPYVLGIFGMVYFYEVIHAVLSYMRLGVAESISVSISQTSAFLLQVNFKMQCMGFLISLFGTGALLNRLGLRICLLLIPSFTGLLLCYLIFSHNSSAAVIYAFIAIKSLNYAFSWPVREGLYIPTVKEIKFKSKSWIDAFGSKFAKTSGSAFNILASKLGSGFFLPVHAIFFASATIIWFLTAMLLGRRYDRAVMDNEVIGAEEEEKEEEGVATSSNKLA